MKSIFNNGRGENRDRIPMNRRAFMAIGATFLLLPKQAFAESVEEFFLRELRALGYTKFEISYTWLGRLRILAFSEKYRRELIINPRTGEGLRDYRTLLDGDDDIFGRSGSGNSGKGSGNSGSGDDDDSDDDDDDDKGKKDDDDKDDDKSSHGGDY